MAAADVVDMLDNAAGEEAGESPELDDADDADADMDAPVEDEEVMEALSGLTSN